MKQASRRVLRDGIVGLRLAGTVRLCLDSAELSLARELCRCHQSLRCVLSANDWGHRHHTAVRITFSAGDEPHGVDRQIAECDRSSYCEQLGPQLRQCPWSSDARQRSWRKMTYPQ